MLHQVGELHSVATKHVQRLSVHHHVPAVNQDRFAAEGVGVLDRLVCVVELDGFELDAHGRGPFVGLPRQAGGRYPAGDRLAAVSALFDLDIDHPPPVTPHGYAGDACELVAGGAVDGLPIVFDDVGLHVLALLVGGSWLVLRRVHDHIKPWFMSVFLMLDQFVHTSILLYFSAGASIGFDPLTLTLSAPTISTFTIENRLYKEL